MPKSTPSRLKLAVFWAASFVLSGAVLLLGMEILLRSAAHWAFNAKTETPLVPSKIPGLGYQLAPNYSNGFFRTDARGFRLRPPDSTPARRNVLLLGDSIAFATGIPHEKSLAPLLEARLTKELGESVAVWNGAVPGYNTVQESILLEVLGPIVKPQLVIVAFCMNDYMEPVTLTPGGALDATGVDDHAGFSLRSLFNRSLALIFMKEKLKDFQKLRPEWFPVWAHYIHYVHKRPGWAKATAALLRMNEEARRLDARLLVVVFPVEQQLRIAERAPQDSLVHFAEANGISMLDLYGSFRLHWRDGLFVDYWGEVKSFDKLHPNVRGHALAADEIAKMILSRPEFYLNAP